MTDIVKRLREGLYDQEIETMLYPLLDEGADEIERLRKVESDLRSCFERVLLDIKFMTEARGGIIPDHILDDMIYQNSFELMTEEFMKEFNNE
jgi:hypothetical protein